MPFLQSQQGSRLFRDFSNWAYLQFPAIVTRMIAAYDFHRDDLTSLAFKGFFTGPSGFFATSSAKIHCERFIAPRAGDFTEFKPLP